MGHHIDTKNSIVPLIDRLNKYPIGLPDSETLRRILAILFSEEEAFIASRFPLEEATIKELVRSTGWEKVRLEARLDKMADKGLVMDVTYNDKTFYLLMPGLIGFFEFSFMKQRQDLPVAELAQLMHEYLLGDPKQEMGREFFSSKTPLTRSLVYEEHIPVSSNIATYESAREIIKNADYGAIAMCYCRHKKEHLHQTCDKNAPTKEICISLGTAAKFMVRRGFAEKRSREELLVILKKARDLNLTHITDNIRHRPSFICNCCSCCCGAMQAWNRGTPMLASSGYIASVEPGLCAGCGLCADFCQFDAISVDNEHAIVDLGTCMGCGVCVSKCPQEALSLLRDPSRGEPLEIRKLIESAGQTAPV